MSRQDHHGRVDQERGQSDERERLWSHGMHEDNMMVQRSNFFLVAQSMLEAYSGGGDLLIAELACNGVPA